MVEIRYYVWLVEKKIWCAFFVLVSGLPTPGCPYTWGWNEHLTVGCGVWLPEHSRKGLMLPTGNVGDEYLLVWTLTSGECGMKNSWEDKLLLLSLTRRPLPGESGLLANFLEKFNAQSGHRDWATIAFPQLPVSGTSRHCATRPPRFSCLTPVPPSLLPWACTFQTY